MVMNVVGDANGNRQSHQTMCRCQRVDAAIAAKEFAQSPASDESRGRKYRIRQVGEAEKESGNQAGEHTMICKFLDAAEEIRLLHVLLYYRPEEVG